MIELPQKVLRDLQNYNRFIDSALESGRGKYKHYSAQNLHDMKAGYIAMRYVNNSFYRCNTTFNFLSKNNIEVPLSCAKFFERYSQDGDFQLSVINI